MLQFLVWMTCLGRLFWELIQFANKADSSFHRLVDLICVPLPNRFAMALFKDFFYAVWSFARKHYEVTDKDSRIC